MYQASLYVTRSRGRIKSHVYLTLGSRHFRGYQLNYRYRWISIATFRIFIRAARQTRTRVYLSSHLVSWRNVFYRRRKPTGPVQMIYRPVKYSSCPLSLKRQFNFNSCVKCLGMVKENREPFVSARRVALLNEGLEQRLVGANRSRNIAVCRWISQLAIYRCFIAAWNIGRRFFGSRLVFTIVLESRAAMKF